MKTALIIILGILTTNLIASYYICTMIQLPICPPGGYSGYSLVIDDDEDELKIEWKYETLNHSLMEEILNETDIELDMGAYFQGDVVTWDVSLLDDSETKTSYDDGYYWEIEVYEHIYMNNSQYSLTSKDFKIKENPEAYAGNMLSGDIDYTNRIIPIQVYDFLPAVGDSIPGFKLRPFYDNNTEYIIGSNSILKVITTNTVFEEYMIYNGDGILRYHSINFENQSVMELYLVKYDVHQYIHNYPRYDLMLLIRRMALCIFGATLISIIFVLLALFAGGKSSKKDDMKKTQIFPTNTNKKKANSDKNGEKRNSKRQLCANCRTLIDAKSTFCHNCGQEVNREIRFCKYCGHLNLKIKKYCTDCGHIF